MLLSENKNLVWVRTYLLMGSTIFLLSCGAGNATSTQMRQQGTVLQDRPHDHDQIKKVPVLLKAPLALPKQTGLRLFSGLEINPMSSDDLALATASPVARRIVENYFQSKNKKPGGHCLDVSLARFEKAYKDVYGHPFYVDLPENMGTKYYTPRQVFYNLYNSAYGPHPGWKTLPRKYRGKGNAGAVAMAGMGELVDWFGIWSGELKPGALMQVWKHESDYNKVVRGSGGKDFDPFGHSFIFLGYERDLEGNIIGIKIADQGYQSYRPLLPRDYEVWWAANLNI